MPYELGIDLGTTYTAAAVYRDGRVTAVTLGNRAAAIPSVVLLREDGDLLTGEAASRRAASEPDRVAREFKRRLGDPTPLFLGSTPYSAESLTAKLLRWVIQTVTAREGEPPARHRRCPEARLRPSSSREGDEIVGSRRAAEAGRLKRISTSKGFPPSRSPEGKRRELVMGSSF